MATNILDISLLNPIKFKRQGYTNPAPYNWKYHQDHFFRDTVPEFMDARDYYQPWQKNDIIYLQILSNYGPHQVEVWSKRGDLVQAFSATYKPSSIEISGVSAYEVAIALATYLEGVFKIIVKSGSPVIDTLESEYFCVQDLHKHSLLLEYMHEENDLEVAFETGIVFRYRIKGGFKDWEPGSVRKVYVDQPGNITQLSAQTFYTEKLVVGDAGGVPVWVIEKLNEIFKCSYILIDGKQWTAATDGSKFEPNRQDGYPMAGWMLEVRPASIKATQRFIAPGDPSSGTSVVYNVEGKGYGPITGPASSNVIQVISNE